MRRGRDEGVRKPKSGVRKLKGCHLRLELWNTKSCCFEIVTVEHKGLLSKFVTMEHKGLEIILFLLVFLYLGKLILNCRTNSTKRMVMT